MSVQQQIQSAAAKGCLVCESILEVLEAYPQDIIEVLIFHRLHFHMEPKLALKCFRQLQEEFVDWNEVRISPIREIQEQLRHGDNSLVLSVYVKDLLEFVHARHHHVSLEHLTELNITEIRRHLKQIRGIEPSSIELVLMLRKEHPVLPLSQEMESVLLDLGLVEGDDSRDRRSKAVFETVGRDAALAFHHLLLEYCRLGGDSAPSGVNSLRKILRQLSRQHGKGTKRKARKKSGSATSGRRQAKKTTKKKTTKHR